MASCDKFIFVENLIAPQVLHRGDACLHPAPPPAKLKGDTGLVDLLRSAIEASSDENGWAHLGSVGQHHHQAAAGFRRAELRLRQAQRADGRYDPVHARAAHPARPQARRDLHERQNGTPCKRSRADPFLRMRHLGQPGPTAIRPRTGPGPADVPVQARAEDCCIGRYLARPDATAVRGTGQVCMRERYGRGWAARLRDERCKHGWTKRQIALRIYRADDERTRTGLPDLEHIIRRITGYEADAHLPACQYAEL